MGQNVHAKVFLQRPTWAENPCTKTVIECGDSTCELCGIASSFYAKYWEPNKQVYDHFFEFLSDTGMCIVWGGSPSHRNRIGHARQPSKGQRVKFCETKNYFLQTDDCKLTRSVRNAWTAAGSSSSCP